MSFSVFQKVKHVVNKYPVTRGMASYAFIWPVGSIIQQTIAGVEEYDFARAARFCIYGSCYVAPTLHVWLKIAVQMFPQKTFVSAVSKAVIEQFTYTPFAMVSFYFGMSLMEGKTVERAKQEVTDKFIPTYKVALVVWPILQTINHTMVAEKNKVVYVSVCSLLWSTFLSYMKIIEIRRLEQEQNASLQQNVR